MEGVIKATNNNNGSSEVIGANVAQQVSQPAPAQAAPTPAPVTVGKSDVITVHELKKVILRSAVCGVNIEELAKQLANYLITIPSYIITKPYTLGIAWYKQFLKQGATMAEELHDTFLVHAFKYYRDNECERGGRLFTDYVEFKSKETSGREAVVSVDDAIDYATDTYFEAVVAEKGLNLEEVTYLLKMIEILVPVANNNIVKTFNSLINNNNNYNAMSAEALDFVFTGLGYERNKEV